HTVGGVFMWDVDRAIYGLGSNTPSGVPYTEEEIRSGGCGDDKMANDEDGSKDEEHEEDGDN
nr:hypothetical protein [Tanacetum cinerariifolium]GFB66596.1 hypothetical protein [Tanacetum cinerariifolium]